MRFVVSDEARADLAEIWDRSLEHFGELQAESYRERIIEAMEAIRRYPEIGARYPEVGPDARALAIGVHRIIYDAGETRIVITGIHHQRQRMRRR